MADNSKKNISNLQLETMPLDSLIEYVRNPRKNDAVVDKMVSCISEFGFRIPIVAKSDGIVIDGHLRLKAAKKLFKYFTIFVINKVLYYQAAVRSTYL